LTAPIRTDPDGGEAVPASLKPFLEELYQTFDRRHLDSDPLLFVHRYKEKTDQEVVAFFASGLAFGNVRSIKASLERLLEVFGPEPSRYVSSFDPQRQAGELPPTVHRWIRRDDAARTIFVLREMLTEFGSLEAAFSEGDDPASPTVEGGLAAFAQKARELDPGPLYGGSKAKGRPDGAAFFFPSPSGGGACKRLNLFLRWTVRSGDGLDLGLWSAVSPSRLLIPLDVHVARIARAVGLTNRRTVGMSMVREVTEALRRLDAEDPIKYDFALARLGILEWCPNHRTVGRCEECPLESVCRL
jgi:uncharacterized protein (TIGR02757 family)